MSRWGRPTKNSKRRDPRYFLNESKEELEESAWQQNIDDYEAQRDAERDAGQDMPEAFMDQEGDAMGKKFWKSAMQDRYKRYLQGDDTFDPEEKTKFGIR
jgi:hypothetical protein